VLELYGAAKVPHRNRDAMARMFGRSTSAVVLKEGNTGGGFGVRGELYPEDFLVCVAAMRLGRPVKWIEDRHEHLIAANHSREQRHHARAAFDAEGRILALEDIVASSPPAWMSAATISASASRISATITLAPSAVNSRASDAPMP
jgi:aerobic carbon-monoxide dehydrogenase large subunit